MQYYTTAEQERRLQEAYSLALAVKQAEIDERKRTIGRIQKYTARAHVLREPRVFIIDDGVVYFGSVGEANRCPSEAVDGGGTYTCDKRFAAAIHAFIERHRRYTVEVHPDGQYGPTVYYCGPGIPAYFTGGGETLVAEDENDYDICCG